jgi:hypothetical protein
MKDIFSLPADIFYHISNFLLLDGRDERQVFKFSNDWRNFCNTSKSLFSDWKKQTQIINLKPLYSDKFSRSSKFRERICGLVENAQEQLVLNFKRELNAELVQLNGCNGVSEIVANYCTFHALPCFPLDYLSLKYCEIQEIKPNQSAVRRFNCFGSRLEGLTEIDVNKLNILEEASFYNMELMDYQKLAHLRSLSISLSNSITDVSCFKNIPKLSLDGCANVVDVSSLCNVGELALTNCNGITDVSSLGRVYNLDLSGCENIRDVSALGNVHILNLEYCTGVTDVSALTNVHEIKLNDFHGNDISGLKSAHVLTVMDAPHIIDISMLRKVKILDLFGCPGIVNFDGLDNVKEFSIDSADTLKTGIQLFRHLSKLTAYGLKHFDSDSSSIANTSDFFYNLRSLSLRECYFETFPNTLVQLRSLQLNDCMDISSLVLDLPFLIQLHVEWCRNLGIVHLTAGTTGGKTKQSTVATVKLSSCSPVRVIISRKVIDLCLVSCTDLVHLTIKNNIGRLSIIDCPKLNDLQALAPINSLVFSDKDNYDYSLSDYEDNE